MKHTGDRSLDEVKVVVYFQNNEGNTIYEEDYHPVLVTGYSFSGDNKPLKPGYIKEMEKYKYYTLDSALSDWQEGKAIAKVVGIKFTESPRENITSQITRTRKCAPLASNGV